MDSQLPPAVEDLINTICKEQSQQPPGPLARRELAALGEESSLKLLNTIRNSRITRSFNGFILCLCCQLREASPSNATNYSSPQLRSPMASASGVSSEGVLLPESVEELIRMICSEQKQSPPGIPARRELAALGEDAAVRILHEIQKRKIKRTFDGYIIYLAKQEVASPCRFEESASSASWSRVSNGPPGSVSSSRRDQANSSCSSDVRRAIEFSEEVTSAFKDHLVVAASTTDSATNGQASNALLLALNDLEFRKAFLIYNYVGRNKVEDVVSVDDIKSIQGIQSMAAFEAKVWDTFGLRFCTKVDRVKYLDWDMPNRYHYYHCYVYPDGSYKFKGPFLQKTATFLQKKLGDHNVLIVKFDDEDSERLSPAFAMTRFGKIAKDGISVGLRRYRLFAFKDGGKQEKMNSTSGSVKSYFVNLESFEQFQGKKPGSFSLKSIHQARCFFMHVHTVSSLSCYMARFSLILSKSITLEVEVEDLEVEVIPDIVCLTEDGSPAKDGDGKDLIHTDGTGFISRDLALRCPRNCCNGNTPETRSMEMYHGVALSEKAIDPPLLIQFRMFHEGRAVKGTVLVNGKLPCRTIQIRPSMIKVNPDPKLSDAPVLNSFEIVTTSNKPGRSRLSKNLIALLNYGGVPKKFFFTLLENALDDAQNVMFNTRAGLRVAYDYGEIDDDFTVFRMISSGIPLDEPYIKYRLSILAKTERKSLKQGRLPIPESFYLMGTADPTGSLNSDEVCIIHENGQISGQVLVYRNPGIHFGDIHVLNAVYVRGLEAVVGNSKFGIFFPTKGPRSLADKMAGGDYDGDTFWISRNPKLLESFKPSEPWSPAYYKPTTLTKKPTDFSDKELEYALFDLFLTTRFQPSWSVGLAADSWLAFMDRLLLLGDDCGSERSLLKKKMLDLVDIYYEALDAPKKGGKVEVPDNLRPNKYPHYMGKEDSKSYKSSSILGEIADKADHLTLEEPSIEVWKLACFEGEIDKSRLLLWEDRYKQYRAEMSKALGSDVESRNHAAEEVMEKYKLMLRTDEFGNLRDWEEISLDALAIYHVTYDFAIQRGQASYCGFAWKIAGDFLLRILTESQEEEPLYIMPSVLRKLLGKSCGEACAII